MPVHSHYVDDSGGLQHDLSREWMPDVLRSGKGLLRVDICETTEEHGRLPTEVFKFHKRADRGLRGDADPPAED